MTEFTIPCPICSPDGKMHHEEYKETHIWVCDTCPSILFEYYGPKDTQALDHYLHHKEQEA